MSTRHTVPASSAAEEDTQALDLTQADYAEEESTLLEPAPVDPDDRARERELRRAERERILGTLRREPEPDAEEPSVGRPPTRRTTDRFLGSLGLVLLRLVTAAIVGLHGIAKALDIPAAQAMLATTVLPEPRILALVLAGAEVALALALMFGLATRIAGLGVAAIGIGALVFVHWVRNPFVGNALAGELELLLGAVGLLLVCLGGGGWSVDGAYRRRRAAEAA